jgi:lipid-A-disaccharide synthase
MKFYIIAGESSGDLIGGFVMKAMQEKSKKVQFSGIGGANMKEAGLESLFPMEQISLFGFLEVVPHIFRLKKLINNTIQDILAQKPDVLITIDSPGFTYRVAKKVREANPNIKLVHIVAPSVWAYKPERAKKYAALYDNLLTLLAFEPKYFTKEGMKSEFIGHPVLEQEFFQKSPALRKEIKIEPDTVAIAVTPGSRKGEIAKHMPVIRKTFEHLAIMHRIKVIFVQNNNSNMQLISKFLEGAKFNYSFSTERLKAYAACDLALSKSGTNNLEIAASGTPMIIGYKLNALTFALLKKMIKIDYSSLLNIIPNRLVVPEYIQADFNVENLVQSFRYLLNYQEKAEKQRLENFKTLESMGFNSSEKPSQRAARIILDMVNVE